MIRISQPDGWVAFYDDESKELFRVLPPPEGFTVADLEKFIEYLKRDVKQREVGPS